MEKIILGAGCFWGVQYYFDQLEGVVATEAGYSGGELKNPTYEEVCTDRTGHAEVVLITYDANILSLDTILQHFFMIHDATIPNRQGPNIGTQYRSAIYYFTEKQLQEIRAAVAKQEHASTITTEIKQATEFWPAEEYHQKFTEKNGYGACHVEPSVVTQMINDKTN